MIANQKMNTCVSHKIAVKLMKTSYQYYLNLSSETLKNFFFGPIGIVIIELR